VIIRIGSYGSSACERAGHHGEEHLRSYSENSRRKAYTSKNVHVPSTEFSKGVNDPANSSRRLAIKRHFPAFLLWAVRCPSKSVMT
jgi:hypothetical protein